MECGRAREKRAAISLTEWRYSQITPLDVTPGHLEMSLVAEEGEQRLDALAWPCAGEDRDPAVERSTNDAHPIAAQEGRSRQALDQSVVPSRARKLSITASGTRPGCSPSMMSFCTPGVRPPCAIAARCHEGVTGEQERRSVGAARAALDADARRVGRKAGEREEVQRSPTRLGSSWHSSNRPRSRTLSPTCGINVGRGLTPAIHRRRPIFG